MNEEEKVYKETNKLKSNTSVSIIPSNYAKSHKINSDLLHKTVLPVKSDLTAEAKCLNEQFTSNTAVIANSSGKAVESDDEYLEAERKNIPKKKNRRNKMKESEVNSKDNNPPNTEPSVTTVTIPGENVTATDEEPKPRIVLTFRSEKPGLRSSNMKIVSPDEKCHSEEANMRRSARFRTVTDKLNRSTEESDDSSKSKSPHKTTKKVVPALSESDEEVETASPPPLKRSNRRRSKEFCENVLANAIARKEKSYNEGTPAQRLITRRIKPTAKVLANRELKLSVETTNSVRLGSEKSPEEGMQTRRSARKRTPETCTSGESSKSSQKEKLAKKDKQKFVQDSDEETLKSQNEYVTVDDIKKRILGGSAPERKMSLKAECKTIHDRENRRFNKLKKKHLSKLGLQAVSGAKQNVSNSNENLTDDSTMDSTNTDAIVEHLNAQKKQLEQEKKLAFHEHENIEMDEEIGECDEQDEEEDQDSELMLILNEDMDNSLDEDFECRAKPNIAAVTPRVTRKSARLEQPDDPRHSDHSDAERADCSSPAGGDEGSAAMAPNEEAHGVAACLCTTYSNVYVTPESLTEPVFCRAVELVNGARIGCSHAAAHSEDGQYAALRRPSVRVPYFLACRLHTAQLRRHLCCPACGVFCTQGTFYQCSEGHLFHLECGVWVSGSGMAGDTPGCPHCGEDIREGVSLNRACYKVRVEMKCSNRQIFLPNQRLQCTPALMGFPDERPQSSECEAIVPTTILPPAPVSLTSLRQRGEATADYEELLTSSAEQRLSHAIANTADAEHVLTRLISGVDLHQALDTIDGGTFMHLAAKHGNLTAVYLLHYAGCRLDATDSQLRTPLMVAVLSLLEKPNSNKKAEKVKCKSPVYQDESSGNEEEKSDKITSNTEKSPQSSKELEMKREKGIMDVIRYMVAAGCDVNFQGAEGITALHMAAQHGGRAVCEALLESHRARIDARDLGGWTPLVWAAENKHIDIVRLLVKHGADASSCDVEGNSVLHWCVLAGCASSLQLLLDAAPPYAVDTVNPHGDTPLHVAARQDHYPCVVVLLARGGRTDMKNSSGELAVDCARGETRTAISLNMQMSLMARDRPPRHKLLSSDISRGREKMAVSCVNDLDDTPMPSDFTYVTKHVYPQYVRLHSTLASMQGCDCSTELCGGSVGGGVAAAGAGAGSACACCVLGVRRWYSEGRLLSTFPFRESPMLFECNETCKCNLIQCPNAVITRLSKRGATFVRTQVFRCRDARGWGLRALTPVLRGTPVALYCGELLKASVADMRSKDQYMFAMEVKRDLLDECEEKEQLCVDASLYGSAARFINHSCSANLAPVRVFTHARDVRAPNIVLFAVRNIRPLEELTFNYGERFWSVKSKLMSCCCGAPNCRYPPKSPVADRHIT